MKHAKPITIFNERVTDRSFFKMIEYLKSDGTYFKSHKEMMDNFHHNKIIEKPVVFCPACGTPNRWENYKREIGDPVDDSWDRRRHAKATCPHCHQTMDAVVELNWGDEDDVEMLDNKVCELLKASAGVYPGRVKSWDESDDKMSFQVEIVLLAGIKNRGKYFIKKSCLYYRLVFNKKTGLSYVMSPVDSKGNPISSKKDPYRFSRRITNMSFAAHSGWPVHTEQVEAIRQRLINEFFKIPEMQQTKLSINDLSRINFLRNFDYNTTLGIVQSVGHLMVSKRLSREIAEMRKIVNNQNYDYMPKYMQKKSIKRRLNQNMFAYSFYKWLYRIGVKDVNIMNAVVDTLIRSPKMAKLFWQLSTWNTKTDKFCKWVIQGRNAQSIKAIIHDILMVGGASYYGELFDAAEMLETIKASKVDIPSNGGNLKEIHDNLTWEFNKVRFANKVIPYSKDELLLEDDSTDYLFRLAKDTDSLYDIGKEMGICVGSYGDYAVSKHCTILTMIHEEKHIACIELHKQGKTYSLVQLKGKYNSVCKDVEVFETWAKAHNIDFESNYDYTTAKKHDKEFFYGNRDFHVENPRDNVNLDFPDPIFMLNDGELTF